MLEDLSIAKDLRYIALRYFNAAGTDPLSRVGERHNPETHLIPLILKATKGEREHTVIHGTDYATPDGTCISDYIHVMDLVDAHVRALQCLCDNGESNVFNCGYGKGYSVRQVFDVARRVTGIDIPIKESPRRAEDPPVLVADSTKLKQKLNWNRFMMIREM